MKTVHLDDVDGVPVLGTLRRQPLRKTLGVASIRDDPRFPR